LTADVRKDRPQNLTFHRLTNRLENRSRAPDDDQKHQKCHFNGACRRPSRETVYGQNSRDDRRSEHQEKVYKQVHKTFKSFRSVLVIPSSAIISKSSVFSQKASRSAVLAPPCTRWTFCERPALAFGAPPEREDLSQSVFFTGHAELQFGILFSPFCNHLRSLNRLRRDDHVD